MSKATKESILADVKRVQEQQPDVTLTRDVYVKKGEYTKHEIHKHWATFKDMLFELDGGLVPISTSTAGAPDVVQTLSDDHWSIHLKKTRIHTLPQLIEKFEVDTTVWAVKLWEANKWDMGYTSGEQKNKKAFEHELYQVKAKFEKKPNIDAIKAELEALKSEVKKAGVPVARKSQPHLEQTGNLLEIMIPDLHAGKLCWSKETGYADYETSIAIKTYRRALDSLLAQSAHLKFDKIVLGVGNDLLQSDNVQGTTYSGTKVDTDSRFHKTYKVVREMLTESIERLREIAPVEVKLVPGNHDTLSVFTLGDSLECRFHNYADVHVDNTPILHKTVEWGNVFLLLTHGHQGKHADYGIWMASRYPQEFGRTKFREVHVGHKHKTALDEKFGVRVRVLSSLTEPDAWHVNNNFVGNIRSAEALVFNKKNGLVAQFFHNEE